MHLTVHWFVEPAISMLARIGAATAPVRLSVDGIATRSSDEQFEALMSGTADAAVTAMDNVMDWNLRLDAGDLRIVAQVERTTHLSLIATAATTDIHGLNGKTLLVDAPANGFVVAARALLDEFGLNSGSYALKPAGGVRERYETLLAGGGDATLLGPPFDGMAVAQGARVLARVNDRYPAFPGQGLVVRRSSYDRVRARMVAWLTAMEYARAQAQANNSVAVSHLAGAGISHPVAETMVDLVPGTLVADRKGIALLIVQRQLAGLRGGNVAYSDIVDSDLLASSREPTQ
ncbi:ABC transporter substrate-binding protein [Bradyrhizobium sp. ma5]|uniref:ABC transporter substrate-binding protein n=1 Tax=Bradyrhizobium sp. ma5 TaxID=3344828 RepID=UPI0035D4C61D